jgi:carbonic anhydrase
MKALVEDINDDEISSFINVAKHGLEKAKTQCGDTCTHDELLSYTEQAVILESTENLKDYPSVAKALKENRIEIKSWQFDMKTGDLLEYNTNTNEFEILTNETLQEDSRQNA